MLPQRPTVIGQRPRRGFEPQRTRRTATGIFTTKAQRHQDITTTEKYHAEARSSRRTDRTADYADYADMADGHDEGLNRPGAPIAIARNRKSKAGCRDKRRTQRARRTATVFTTTARRHNDYSPQRQGRFIHRCAQISTDRYNQATEITEAEVRSWELEVRRIWRRCDSFLPCGRRELALEKPNAGSYPSLVSLLRDSIVGVAGQPTGSNTIRF